MLVELPPELSSLPGHADILSDPTSRELYDLHGLDANRQIGSEAGKGNAREAWDEFKPFKKENKRTKARDSVRTQSSAGADVPTSGASEPRCEDPNERCGLESASSTGVGQSICSFPTPAPPQFAGKRLLEWHGYILAVSALQYPEQTYLLRICWAFTDKAISGAQSTCLL